MQVGQSTFPFNTETGELTGNTTAGYVETSVGHDTFKYEKWYGYSGNDVLEKYENAAWVTKLKGKEVYQNLPVTVNALLNFEVISGKKVTRSTSAYYIVNITENPCTEIKFKDCTDDRRYNLSINAKTGFTVTPEFVPQYNDSPITDVPSWNIESGDDLVSMAVADDGKSATFNKKDGVSYGSAKVSVKAGSVTEEFYINIVAPTSLIVLSERTKDLLIGNVANITAEIKYAKGYENDAKDFPDAVTVSSNNENVF